MARVIYKYPIKITDEQTIKMPFGAEILCIKKQGIGYCLWALVYPEQLESSYKIEVIGTGNYTDIRSRKYITTIIDNPFVWHFFTN